jgi:hypothetical protein
MASSIPNAAQRRLVVFSSITAGAAIVATVAGALALTGWLLGVESLKAIVPGTSP